MTSANSNAPTARQRLLKLASMSESRTSAPSAVRWHAAGTRKPSHAGSEAILEMRDLAVRSLTARRSRWLFR